MYSKAKSIREMQTVTPPPGYDGNMFGKAENGYEEMPNPQTEQVPDLPKKEEENKLLHLLSGVGKEDLIIISLIIILSGEKAESDIILMLLLLLCVR